MGSELLGRGITRGVRRHHRFRMRRRAARLLRRWWWPSTRDRYHFIRDVLRRGDTFTLSVGHGRRGWDGLGHQPTRQERFAAWKLEEMLGDLAAERVFPPDPVEIDRPA